VHVPVGIDFGIGISDLGIKVERSATFVIPKSELRNTLHSAAPRGYADDPVGYTLISTECLGRRRKRLFWIFGEEHAPIVALWNKDVGVWRHSELGECPDDSTRKPRSVRAPADRPIYIWEPSEIHCPRPPTDQPARRPKTQRIPHEQHDQHHGRPERHTGFLAVRGHAGTRFDHFGGRRYNTRRCTACNLGCHDRLSYSGDLSRGRYRSHGKQDIAASAIPLMIELAHPYPRFYPRSRGHRKGEPANLTFLTMSVNLPTFRIPK
jgi:hypothetical protein